MYYLKLDGIKIIGYLEGEKLNDEYIEVTQEEYKKAFMYEEYNPKIKEFSRLKDIFNGNLEIKKADKIDESKNILEKWLEEHPLESTIHGKKALYSVTEEKQALLTRNLMIAQLNRSDTTTWNEKGGICEEWKVSELAQLALEIEAYVRPKIKKQQTYEVQINNCSTVEEVNGIEIEYDTI